MTWLRVDENFEDCLPGATAADIGTWTCAKAYANRRLTDGFVPDGALPRFGTDRKGVACARHLAELGHFVRDDARGGYVIVGHLDHNPSRAQVEAHREEKSRAGRAGAAAKWSKPAELPDRPMAPAMGPVSGLALPRHPAGMADACPDPDPDPDPDPVPIRTQREEKKERETLRSSNVGGRASAKARSSAAGKGTRIAEDWQPGPSVIDWATAEDIDHEPAIDRFRDHFVQMPNSNPNSRKASWDVAFRAWLRRDKENGDAPSLNEKLRARRAACLEPGKPMFDLFEGHDGPDVVRHMPPERPRNPNAISHQEFQRRRAEIDKMVAGNVLPPDGVARVRADEEPLPVREQVAAFRAAVAPHDERLDPELQAALERSLERNAEILGDGVATSTTQSPEESDDEDVSAEG